MPEALAKSGRIGVWIRRSINPLRMPADIFSTFDTQEIERDIEWAKAGQAALRGRASTAGIPLIRNDQGDLDEQASIESVCRLALAAHADGQLSDAPLRELQGMTVQQLRAWCGLQKASARKRAVFYFVLSGIAVLVAFWSVLVAQSEAMIGSLAGLTWLLLAVLIFLYGWRDYREAQGRVWRPVPELLQLFR